MNRSAFYLYHETLNDLLNESIQHLYGQFPDCTKGNSIEPELASRLHLCPVRGLNLVTPEYLMPYLSYIKQHKHLFRYVFIRILERCHVPKQDRHYMMAFYIRGLMAIING